MNNATRQVTVKFTFDINLAGAKREEIVNLAIPNCMTEHQEIKFIDSCFKDWVDSFLDSGWNYVDKGDK
jgi:hypothetical protein